MARFTSFHGPNAIVEEDFRDRDLVQMTPCYFAEMALEVELPVGHRSWRDLRVGVNVLISTLKYLNNRRYLSPPIIKCLAILPLPLMEK